MLKTMVTCMCGLLLSAGAAASAATFYVSPQGDDSSAGTSPERAWKSAKKVDTAKFDPGDTILFQRGGEWHDRLQASSSGKDGLPITYDAYGDGAKPKFWGSDVLANAAFTPAGDNLYSCKIAVKADTALQNQIFIPADWKDGTLTITVTGSDPRTDGKVYSGCTRGNVIFSNRKNHLVFRNLVVDETAGQLHEGPNQGYGVRIEGSTDVLLDSCEAYRCGRHHFAAINSTGFVGRHLKAEYVQPKTPGDNSAYVSYADAGAPVAACTSEWDDISSAHMDDGKGGQYLMFVSHGDHQGLITVKNVIATTKLSFMSGPVIVKGGTLRGTASIENWGTGVLIDGVTLLDSAAIDQWASNGTIQNCVARLTPSGAGPTGFSTAILCRAKAKQNVIRFNTLVTGTFNCLALGGADSATKWYGNIMLATGSTVAKPSEPVTAADVASADYNFYGPGATFAGKSLADWQALGFDAHSLSGDPKFLEPDKGNFTLQAASPCLHAAAVNSADIPVNTDPADYNQRPLTGAPNMGAFEGVAAQK